MQEEIPRFHGILRNIRGDEGNAGETRLFWKKAWQKNFMHGGGDDGTAMLLLSFSFGAPSLVVGRHIAQHGLLRLLKFLLFPSKCDLISFWKYGTIVSLDVR